MNAEAGQVAVGLGLGLLAAVVAFLISAVASGRDKSGKADEEKYDSLMQRSILLEQAFKQSEKNLA